MTCESLMVFVLC